MINKLVVENLKHRPVRTLLSIVAISIQVTMVLTLVGLSRGMLDEQTRRVRGIGADILIRPPGTAIVMSGGQMFERIIPVIIEKQPHVRAATGALVYGTDLVNYITGIDLAQFNKLSGGFHFVEGGPFQGPDDIMVDELWAKEHKIRIGQPVKVMNRDWRLSGIYEPGMLARMVVPLARLQELSANTGKVTMVYVAVDQPSEVKPTIEALSARLKEYKVFSMEEFTALFSAGNVPMLKEFIWVVIGLGVVVGFLVVFLSMYTAVLERTREIGVLKALGASPGYIINILLRETAVLAIAGSVVGILFGYVTRFAVNKMIPGTLIQAIVYDWWPITTAIAIVGALIGAIYPGLKAARQDAIDALTYE